MKIKHISIIAATAGLLVACSSSKKAATKEVVEEVKNEIFDEGIDRSIRPTAGKAKEVTIGNYQEFNLQSGNGMKVFVIENHKLPTLSYSLSLDIDPMVEGDKAGYTSIAGSLIESGTKSRNKEKLDKEIDFMGANIGASSSGVYASGLSKYKSEMMEILADVTLNPAFPQEEFDKLIKQTLTGLEASSEEPDAIASNIKYLTFYGKGHPYGEFETEKTVKNITLEDCKNYYNKYFTPNTAVLTIVGDITVDEARVLAEKSFGSWKSGKTVEAKEYSVKKPTSPRVTVVNKDGAVQSNITIGNVAELKLGDADYEAVKVLNNIFGSGFSGRLFQNLREDKEYTYGAYGGVSSNKLIGNFSSSAKVRNEVTDSAVEQFLYEINKIRTDDVSAEELQNAKNYIAGTFAQALESPRTVASFAANIERYKLNKDYFKGYLKRIDAVTIADIKRVAKKYMTPSNIHIIIVGDAAEVGPKLARFGTLSYLDKEGNKIEAPKATGDIISDITAEEVITKYIDAIGGKAKLTTIKNIKTEMGAEMQGMQLSMNQSQMAPNKTSMVMSAMGMNLMEQKFDGTKASVKQQGMDQPVPEDMLKDMAISSYLFPELIYAKKGVKTKLKGIKSVKSNPAYEIETTMPSGDKSSTFYDIKSGLKVRETSTEQGPTGPVSSSTEYGNYKEVSGVKFPHSISYPLGGGMTLKAEVKSITVNGTMDASIFEIK
jgi:predicted Zn-dependent peptidase